MGYPPRETTDEELQRVGAHLRRLARGLLYDSNGADDLVQDVWILALLKGPPSGWAPSAWLAGAVRKLSLARRRDDQRRRYREERAARPEPSRSTSDVMEQLEVSRRVLDEVEALDEPYRTAIVMRFLDGLAPR